MDIRDRKRKISDTIRACSKGDVGRRVWRGWGFGKVKMLENTTNLTNVTVLVDVLKSHIDPILIAVLILVTVVIFVVGTKIARNYKRIDRIQQVCDDLLIHGQVKLIYDESGFEYYKPYPSELDFFINAIQKEFKHFRYRKGWGLYKKAEKAVDEYHKLVKSVNTKITSIIVQLIDKAELETWDENLDKGKSEPIEYAVPKNITRVIIWIVKRKLKGEHKNKMSITLRNGRFELKCDDQNAYVLAKSDSEEKLKTLRESIQLQTNDNEIIDAVKELNNANQNAREKVDAYNKVLAKVIQDLRFYPWKGFFR